MYATFQFYCFSTTTKIPASTCPDTHYQHSDTLILATPNISENYQFLSSIIENSTRKLKFQILYALECITRAIITSQSNDSGRSKMDVLVLEFFYSFFEFTKKCKSAQKFAIKDKLLERVIK